MPSATAMPSAIPSGPPTTCAIWPVCRPRGRARTNSKQIGGRPHAWRPGTTRPAATTAGTWRRTTPSRPATAQHETFLRSNITPQLHALNAGLWQELEQKIATSYPARYAEVWAITGPVFAATPKKLRGGVAVPEAFFLIVIDEHEGKLRTLALIVPQEAPPDAEPERYLTRIDEI